MAAEHTTMSGLGLGAKPGPGIRARSSISSSTSTSSSSSNSNGRRLSRKQPPELTESLLDIIQRERQPDIDSDKLSIASSTRTVMPTTTITTAGDSFQQDFAWYTLKVDPTLPLDDLRRHAPSPFAWSRQRDLPSPALSQQSIHTRTHSGPSSPRGSLAGSSFSNPNSHSDHSTSTSGYIAPHAHARTASSPISKHYSTHAERSHSRNASGSGSGAPSLTTCSTASTSCWSSSLDERMRYQQALATQTPAGKGAKENRKQRKERKRREAEQFSADTPPSLRDLFEAGGCEVMNEHGERVQFRNVIGRGTTIVVFIRHWYCPLCAQYMNSMISQVSPRALEEAGVELVVIGNGSAKMLDGYRNKSFKCPFKMYTDPSLALYRALGLTRQTGNAGADDDAGSYLVQTPLEATMQTIKRATKMPLRAPGHFTQLGGEFVFDGEGSLSVSYTHRMTTTRDHSPIEQVCAAAGVRLEYIHYEPGPRPPPVHRHSLIDVEFDAREYNAEEQEERAWKVERERTLQDMQRRKEERRRGKAGVGHVRVNEEMDEVVVVMDGSESDEMRDLSERMEQFGRLS